MLSVLKLTGPKTWTDLPMDNVVSKIVVPKQGRDEEKHRFRCEDAYEKILDLLNYKLQGKNG